MYLLLCVCVLVAAAVFSSSVMFCSVSSDTLHFSITTISISVCAHTHTFFFAYLHKCPSTWHFYFQCIRITFTSHSLNTNTQHSYQKNVTSDHECTFWHASFSHLCGSKKQWNALKQERWANLSFFKLIRKQHLYFSMHKMYRLFETHQIQDTLQPMRYSMSLKLPCILQEVSPFSTALINHLNRVGVVFLPQKVHVSFWNGFSAAHDAISFTPHAVALHKDSLQKESIQSK